MSDIENQVEEVEAAEPVMDEKAYLLQRARVMGLTPSGNIGVEKLKKMIADKLAGEAVAEETAPATEEVVNPAPSEATKPVEQTKPSPMSERQRLIREATKLVRLRITNLDPKKKDLPGEVLTVANETIGTIRKFIPYGEATDNGFHVPYALYEMMKDREFLSIKLRADKRTGSNYPESRMVKEFALEVLPQLTPKELADLAASQAAGRNID